jgi:hypothetical protein
MIRLQDLLSEDLRRWVKEKWVDQHGRPCGNDKTKGVKKCRPSKKVSGDTPKTWSSFDKKEKSALVAQKRKVGMGKRTPKAEAVVDDRIECDNCDHSWPISTGGDDLYICHECDHDNTPTEMLDEKKKPKRDACYYKVKARYTRDGGTWPSAYGSLALSACRKKGAKNWGKKSKNEEIEKDIMEEMSVCTECAISMMEDIKAGKFDVITEAEYQGRKVQLGKPMRGDVKKFKVYVKNPKGNVIKVNFGDPNMRIRKSNPARRRSFRARHRCHTANDRTSARYWSCRNW